MTEQAAAAQATETTPANATDTGTTEAAVAQDTGTGDMLADTDTGTKGADAAADLLGDGEGEATKDGEGEKAEPIAYDIKVPESIQVDDDAMKVLTELGNQHGIKPEAMQALVDFQGQLSAKAMESMQAEQAKAAQAHAEQQQQLKARQDALRADPNWNQIKQDATHAIDKLMPVPSDLKPGELTPAELIRKSGLAADPVMIRSLAMLGQSARNDRIGGGGSADTGPQDTDHMLYPGLK